MDTTEPHATRRADRRRYREPLHDGFEARGGTTSSSSRLLDRECREGDSRHAPNAEAAWFRGIDRCELSWPTSRSFGLSGLRKARPDNTQHRAHPDPPHAEPSGIAPESTGGFVHSKSYAFQDQKAMVRKRAQQGGTRDSAIDTG